MRHQPSGCGEISVRMGNIGQDGKFGKHLRKSKCRMRMTEARPKRQPLHTSGKGREL